MSARGRLVAVAVALLPPGLLLGAWLRAGAIEIGSASLSLPRQLGPWVATEDQRLEPEILEQIGPDAHLLRLYEAPGRSLVWVYLGLYAGRGSYQKAAHEPEVCYPAQGWEVLGSRTVAVEIGAPGSPALRAKVLEAHRGQEKEAVLYWFQPAGRWPAHGALEEILRIGDAMRGAPQYAFVRLSAPTSDRAQGATEEDLVEFARLVAPAIRESVEGIASTRPAGS